MIKLHHLKQSRGQRILWLLEEIGAKYEVARYRRDPETGLAPPELRNAHPVGKSPIIEDGDVVIAESGAIVVYLCERYRPDFLIDPSMASWPRYIECLHYAEGSAMSPLMLESLVSKWTDGGDVIKQSLDRDLKLQLDFMSQLLGTRNWFVDDRMTAADFMLIVPILAAASTGRPADYGNLLAFVERVTTRPAWLRALAQGDQHPQLAD